MATQQKPNIPSDHMDELGKALGGDISNVQHLIKALPATDIAHLLRSSPPATRAVLWQFVDEADEGEVLQSLGDDLQSQFLRNMDAAAVAAATEGLEPDDMADLLQRLPEKVMQEVLRTMDQLDRARVEQVLVYPKNSAGGLMNTDAITVRDSHTVDAVLRYLRRHVEIPAMTDNLIVVNRTDNLIGLVPLRILLTSDATATVRDIMEVGPEVIPADMPAKEVAHLFERHNLVSAPVIDEQGKLLGRITVDDVVGVIRGDADHSLMSMAGLDEEEDTFAPVFKTAPRRAVWLGINLITAFIAAGGHQHVPGHHRQGGGPRRADAHCRQHGRHRRHPDPDRDDSRHSPGADRQRQPELPGQPGVSGGGTQRHTVVAGGGGGGIPVVLGLAHRRHHRRRNGHQPDRRSTVGHPDTPGPEADGDRPRPGRRRRADHRDRCGGLPVLPGLGYNLLWVRQAP